MARARSVLSRVLYTHPQPFDDSAQRFPCCGGARGAQGCQARSLRGPEDLTQAQISIQFALSALVSLKSAPAAAWSDAGAAERQIEAMRVACRALWEDFEKQKRLEEAQRAAQREAGKAGDVAQQRLARRREEELRVEREKREQQQRIERIAEEEKARFRHVLDSINEVEIVQEKKQPRKARQTKQRHARGAEGAKKGALEESSEEESEDNAQISEGDLKGVFGDLSDSESASEDAVETKGKTRSKGKASSEEEEEEEESEKEEKREAPKKRVRAVESSDDDDNDDANAATVHKSDASTPETKRTHLEEIEQELNNVFSEEDCGVRSNKQPTIFYTSKNSGRRTPPAPAPG